MSRLEQAQQKRQQIIDLLHEHPGLRECEIERGIKRGPKSITRDLHRMIEKAEILRKGILYYARVNTASICVLGKRKDRVAKPEPKIDYFIPRLPGRCEIYKFSDKPSRPVTDAQGNSRPRLHTCLGAQL